MSCRRKPPASCGSCDELRRDLLGELEGEPHDAVGVRRGLAERAAAVVVQLERAGEALDDARDRRRGASGLLAGRLARSAWHLGLVVDCEHRGRLSFSRESGRWRRLQRHRLDGLVRRVIGLRRGRRSPHLVRGHLTGSVGFGRCRSSVRRRGWCSFGRPSGPLRERSGAAGTLNEGGCSADDRDVDLNALLRDCRRTRRERPPSQGRPAADRPQRRHLSAARGLGAARLG